MCAQTQTQKIKHKKSKTWKHITKNAYFANTCPLYMQKCNVHTNRNSNTNKTSCFFRPQYKYIYLSCLNVSQVDNVLLKYHTVHKGIIYVLSTQQWINYHLILKFGLREMDTSLPRTFCFQMWWRL